MHWIVSQVYKYAAEDPATCNTSGVDACVSGGDVTNMALWCPGSDVPYAQRSSSKPDTVAAWYLFLIFQGLICWMPVLTEQP